MLPTPLLSHDLTWTVSVFPNKRELLLIIAEVYFSDVEFIYKEIRYFQSNSFLENHEVNIKTNKLELNNFISSLYKLQLILSLKYSRCLIIIKCLLTKVFIILMVKLSLFEDYKCILVSKIQIG